MKPRSVLTQDANLGMVGSTVFGRYPKISIEQTFNMIISDGWLVDNAGYQLENNVQATGTGRGIYASNRSNSLFCVIENNVYMLNTLLSPTLIGQINTYFGDVFIAENNGNQIAFCDKSALYIYNYITGSFVKASLPTGVTPGYVTFQDGYFIVPDINTSFWYLSALNNGLSWLWGAGAVPVAGSLSTKPDKAIAAVRFPGKGNLLIVLGNTVGELWQDVGSPLFPYQRISSINIDFGTVNSSTIAAEENIVAWVGRNERSGPVILYTTGGEINRLSNDGIDFRLSHLSNPEDSFAFFIKQDGHLLYQVTFNNPRDNLTLQYDFNTQKFFTLTDNKMNYHIARRVAFYNNNYYFISDKDPGIYLSSTNITTYNDNLIPRIRCTPFFRFPNSGRAIVNNITFPMEMGVDTNFPYTDGSETIPITQASRPRIDFCVSKNGGESFGSYKTKLLNPLGKRQNRVNFWGMGVTNDFCSQFRFWSPGRIVVGEGLIGWYQ